MLYFPSQPVAALRANAPCQLGLVPAVLPRTSVPPKASPPPADWLDPEELDPQPVTDSAWDVFELDPDEHAEPLRSDFPYLDQDDLP